jgi:GT2 family glycosyltransferase
MITIIIPIYISNPLHLEFTQECLASIHTNHRYEIIIVKNYVANSYKNEVLKLETYPHVKVIPNPQGNILAAAWNLGIKSAISHHSSQILILNNDIVLHPQAIDTLVDFSNAHPDILLVSGSEWANLRTLNEITTNSSFSPHPHFSCFLITPKTIKTVGYFDENFKFGYFEDNDYHLRLLRSGYQAASIDAAKFYHYGSRTIKSDDSLKIEAQKHYHLNRAYFQKKWGIDIHGEAFDPPETILKKAYPTPFNTPQKSLKDW